MIKFIWNCLRTKKHKENKVTASDLPLSKETMAELLQEINRRAALLEDSPTTTHID